MNPEVDYGSIQQALVAGRKVQVIDDFLTPKALEQVRKFCLESTVWRHPYKFGYVGAFPQDGFASVSLFAIAEEFSLHSVRHSGISIGPMVGVRVRHANCLELIFTVMTPISR